MMCKRSGLQQDFTTDPFYSRPFCCELRQRYPVLLHPYAGCLKHTTLFILSKTNPFFMASTSIILIYLKPILTSV